MLELTRFTCEYIDREDRIRLLGETVEGTTVVLWLTQRLVLRLVPHLCEWVEKNSTVAGFFTDHLPGQAQLWQGFAQQAAQAELAPQTPVTLQPHAPRWLVVEVDVNAKPEHISLCFKGDEGLKTPSLAEFLLAQAVQPHSASVPSNASTAQPVLTARKASIVLTAVQLRQWLSIVHHQCQQAQWPSSCWPDWLQDAQQTSLSEDPPPPTLLH